MKIDQGLVPRYRHTAGVVLSYYYLPPITTRSGKLIDNVVYLRPANTTLSTLIKNKPTSTKLRLKSGFITKKGR
ncbi:hypothetical protein L1F30_12055 [Simiduia sp. 21SJ11W-1]|uniref:hypothetical protein n=1 Tax=Simiduia sp. 21SJ11W-1 TaxID=2909669 RepID=UPI00209D911B|nr:hypothetical protein [Simiduia sp. 21SJ11W-1]UTA46894.1 hypothetical protein L1F30_12055 [Simiduia sp. 21SJ11W-1]